MEKSLLLLVSGFITADQNDSPKGHLGKDGGIQSPYTS